MLVPLLPCKNASLCLKKANAIYVGFAENNSDEIHKVWVKKNQTLLEIEINIPSTIFV